MSPCPEYRIYFAAQKIVQLYRQLPEACISVQKSSQSRHRRGSIDFQRPYPSAEGEEKEKPFCATRISLDGSASNARDAVFEKNEMYQLRRVLHCLRRADRLCAFRGEAVPGLFYSFAAPFAAESGPVESPGIVLRTTQSDGRGTLRLFCEPDYFYGADRQAAQLFAWGEGCPLPLAGVMLCLTAQGSSAAGLPLYLAIQNKQ